MRAYLIAFGCVAIASQILSLQGGGVNVLPRLSIPGQTSESSSEYNSTAANTATNGPPYEKAYITLMATAEYNIGTQILICRLRAFSPDLPIIVLVDESIVPLPSPSFYKAMNVHIIMVPNPATQISLQNATNSNNNVANQVRVGTYTKLNLWGLEGIVETGLYLDADTLPVRNPEYLFDELSSQWNLAASGWPPNPKKGQKSAFNSGVMVYRPSYQTYQALIKRLITGNFTKDVANPTEQDLLVSHFAELETTRLEYARTSPLAQMNYRPSKEPDGPKSDQDATIVHWIGNPKPWSRVLGKSTTVKGQGSDGDKAHPEWASQLYECEMERFLNFCHNLDSAVAANFSCLPPLSPKR